MTKLQTPSISLKCRILHSTSEAPPSVCMHTAHTVNHALFRVVDPAICADWAQITQRHSSRTQYLQEELNMASPRCLPAYLRPARC